MMSNITKQTGLLAIWFLLLSGLAGCQTYRRMPLDKAAMENSLHAVDWKELRIAAAAIKHPLLSPVSIDITNGLSPDGAAIVAVILNPKLRAVRDQKGIAAAQLLQARILPNPQLSYNLDVPTGGVTKGAVHGYGAVLSWDTIMLITRGAEISAARAQALSVDLDIAWQEWQVAQAAKLSAYRLIYFEKELALVREEETALKNNLDAVKQAVDIGAMTIIDLAAAKVALQRVHTSVLVIRGQQEQERLALNQALGFMPERIIPLQRGIEFPAVMVMQHLQEIINGIEERRLDLLALKIGYQSQEEHLRAAILGQFPQINVGFSRLRDTGDVVTTGFNASISLPFFDRNQGRIAIAKASRQQLFDEYMARLFEARSATAAILADMESIQQQITATKESIPTLKNLVQIYYQGLLDGNVDVLSYYRARDDLISKQIELLDLQKNLAEKNIALEIASGRYLGQRENKKVSK